jgi:hypothetical protein
VIYIHDMRSVDLPSHSIHGLSTILLYAPDLLSGHISFASGQCSILSSFTEIIHFQSTGK